MHLLSGGSLKVQVSGIPENISEVQHVMAATPWARQRVARPGGSGSRETVIHRVVQDKGRNLRIFLYILHMKKDTYLHCMTVIVACKLVELSSVDQCGAGWSVNIKLSV